MNAFTQGCRWRGWLPVVGLIVLSLVAGDAGGQAVDPGFGREGDGGGNVRLGFRLSRGHDGSPAGRPRKGIVRFGGAWAEASGERRFEELERYSVGISTIYRIEGDYRVRPDRARGAWVSYEHPLGRRFGLELSAEALDADVSIDGGTVTYEILQIGWDRIELAPRTSPRQVTGRVDVLPLTVGLNFHPRPSRRLDLYFGPRLGTLLFDDLEVDGLATEIDDELTWGAAAGLDLPLRDSRWSFSTALRYLRARATLDDRIAVRGRRLIVGRVVQDIEDPTPIDFDQLTLRLGVAYRF